MRIECPGCLKGFNIPEERCPLDRVFAFPCPNCKHRIKLDLRTESTNIRSSSKLETGIDNHQEKAALKKKNIKVKNQTGKIWKRRFCET